MFLRVENISKTYQEHKVLDEITFSLEEGKLISILGPSGCGKSTLLKIIGGFVYPNSGKVFLRSKDITNLPVQERPVATVFQSYGLFPHMSVLQNIIYGLKFKNIKKNEARKQGLEMLSKLSMSGYENKKPSNLSGGEQQRVALGRSLIIQPDLLLLDEPLSNLDAKLRISMRDEIKKIQSEFNVSTIFVTHDQEEALTMSDQLILMNDGKIEQIGSPETIYDAPESAFSLNFIGNSNSLDDNSTYIRPEKVFFKRDKGKENAIISNIIFQGSTIVYEIKTDKEEVLRSLHLNNENETEEYEIGERIYVDCEIQKIRRKS